MRGHARLVVADCLTHCAARRRGASPGLSCQAGQAHCRLHSWRRRRYQRAHPGRQADRDLRLDHRREQAGRRHQYRQRIRGQVGARRLHAALHQSRRRDQHVALQEAALRRAARFRRRVGLLGEHQPARRARLAPRQIGRRAGRARARAAGSAQLFLGRFGNDAAPRGRALQAAHRNQDRARALQGQRAVDHRAHRRRRAALLRQPVCDRTAREEPGACARSRWRAPSARASCPKCLR